MSRYGIVVIGYNRIDSIHRLIDSLLKAKYHRDVDLIISIDNSGTCDVEDYAKSVVWKYGKKTVKTFPKRLGLKEHVLTCGNYINEFGFDAIIVLEDDVVVSPDYFDFAVQCVEKYQNSNEIAGISLYSYSWNVYADRPFIPVYKGYDVFFMQYPQSWGQVWMKHQWNAFYNWYSSQKYVGLDSNKIPENVLNWPDTSWLKLHVQYCIAENKYFAYPYHSLSTNFADAGTHYAFSTNKMQVPISVGISKSYLLPGNIEDTSIYDAFYESCQMADVLGIEKVLLEVDMYGTKKQYNSSAQYLLTTSNKKYKLVKSFGLQMRPWEMNVIYDVPGNEIFLYDMGKPGNSPVIKHKSLIHWLYDTQGEVILKRNFIDIMFNEIFNKIKRR